MIPFSSKNPYPTTRSALYGRRGMVATSHPLAVEAGMSVLRKGGNAVDAAVAAAAALCVTEPAATGPGGDLFAIVYTGGKLYGLNASGHSAKLMTGDELRKRGLDYIPDTGWLSASVPGGPAGWAALCKRFGRLPMPEVFAPAVELAEAQPINGGYAGLVNSHIKKFTEKNDPIFEPWFDLYAPGKEELKAGQIVRLTDLAKSLKEIAETGGESFYRGRLAEKMAEYSEKTGGLLRYEDFAEYECEWPDPISINYRGYDVWELPPNGQGITPLIALNIMEGFNPVTHDDTQTVHQQIECMKLAFADAYAYIADPNYMTIKPEALLCKSYAEKRRSLIGEKAIAPPPGDPPQGGTVYLCTADGEGNMVSLIQSVANSFGSGVVIPGTGILLQNRGANFSMKPNHPNLVGPRKRPFNTIIPGFLTKDGQPIGPMGVMGGFMQPQGHMQITMNMIDFGMNPQTALDAPRWFWQREKEVRMESTWPESVREALIARGHDVSPNSAFYGRGAIIVRTENGVLIGGTESRGGGAIAAY